MVRPLLLTAFLACLAPAALAEPLHGPSLAGSWYDNPRGLWLVLEPTGTEYRVNPVLLERWPDGRLVNRFDGLVLPGKLLRGTLGFGGEGRPAGDQEQRLWRIEGSVRLAATLDRLDGEIRIEAAPYAEPIRPSQRIELHRHDRSPTLSLLTANRPQSPKLLLPASPAERDLPVAVGVQYLPNKSGVEQSPGPPPFDLEPRRHALTTNVQGRWKLNPEALW